MPGLLSKPEIIKQLAEASNEFTAVCSAINDELFFYQQLHKHQPVVAYRMLAPLQPMWIVSAAA